MGNENYIQSIYLQKDTHLTGAHLGGLGPGAAVLLLKHDLVLLHIPLDGLGRGTKNIAQHTQSLVHVLHTEKTGWIHVHVHCVHVTFEVEFLQTQSSEDMCDAYRYTDIVR